MTELTLMDGGDKAAYKKIDTFLLTKGKGNEETEEISGLKKTYKVKPTEALANELRLKFPDARVVFQSADEDGEYENTPPEYDYDSDILNVYIDKGEKKGPEGT